MNSAQQSGIEYIVKLNDKLEALSSPSHTMALLLFARIHGVGNIEDSGDPLAKAVRRYTMFMDLAKGELTMALTEASIRAGILDADDPMIDTADLKDAGLEMCKRLAANEV